MPGARVRLPPEVPDAFEVYVNGVVQRRGEDFEVSGRTLVFAADLRQEGRLGLWRWFLGAWGIGTYRQNDSVDVRFRHRGGWRVAERLDIEPDV